MNDQRSGSDEGTGARRQTIILIVLAVLAVAVHLGVGGAALAASSWTGWATDIVLAAVAVKASIIVAHFVLGRLVIRRRNASKAR